MPDSYLSALAFKAFLLDISSAFNVLCVAGSFFHAGLGSYATHWYRIW